MKRFVDIIGSFTGLILFSPVLLVAMFLIWRQDRHSPFYIASRVGKDSGTFRMVKLRSMIINADKSGVDSTSNSDNRITAVGHFVRRYKLDELMQLWNVLKGDMSLVGPRPNVAREVATYTAIEKRLLSVRPGITDIASIVFSDEGKILEGSNDADLLYNQIIRPWKSRLGLLYIEHRTILMDLELILLTVLAIIDKRLALRGVKRILVAADADAELIRVAERLAPLYPHPPPGASDIVSATGRGG